MVMEGSYREARFGSQGMAEYARGDVDGHCATDEASATAVEAAQRESRPLTAEEQTAVAAAKRSALRFPDTPQQIANAHSALAAGIGEARLCSSSLSVARNCCSSMQVQHMRALGVSNVIF